MPDILAEAMVGLDTDAQRSIHWNLESARAIAVAVRGFLSGWYALIERVVKEALTRFGPVGRLKPDDVATLVGNAFIGSEALLLLGFEQDRMPIRRALRRFGALIRRLETGRVSSLRDEAARCAAEADALGLDPASRGGLRSVLDRVRDAVPLRCGIIF